MKRAEWRGMNGEFKKLPSQGKQVGAAVAGVGLMQASRSFCKTSAGTLPNLRSPLKFPLPIPRPIAALRAG